jgi:hypothetical protein
MFLLQLISTWIGAKHGASSRIHLSRSIYNNSGKGTTFQIFLPAKVIEKYEPRVVKQTVKVSESYLLVSA